MLFTFLRRIWSFLTSIIYKKSAHSYLDQCYDEKSIERGDLYIKQLVENITIDRAAKSDPFSFENLIIYGITLHNAHLTGLKTLHQAGICVLTESRYGLLARAKLGVGPLHFKFDVMMKLGRFKRKLKFVLSLSYGEVQMDIDGLKGISENGALVKSFITKLSGFKCSINGLEVLDMIINEFLSILTTVLKLLIRNLLKYKFEKYLDDKLRNYKFPVEAILIQSCH